MDRASKLTLVLKDSFTRNTARTVMIANVSPAASSAGNTTLGSTSSPTVRRKSVSAVLEYRVTKLTVLPYQLDGVVHAFDGYALPARS